jgi:hypothetical protein
MISSKCSFLIQIYVKLRNIYFFKSSSGSRITLHGETGIQADTVRLMVAFRSIANAPKKQNLEVLASYSRTLIQTEIINILCMNAELHTTLDKLLILLSYIQRSTSAKCNLYNT